MPQEPGRCSRACPMCSTCILYLFPNWPPYLASAIKQTHSSIIPFGMSYAPCAHAHACTPTCTNVYISTCANAPALVHANTCLPGWEGSMILSSLLRRHMCSAATHFGCPSSCVHVHAVTTILAVFSAVSHSTCAGDRPPHYHPGCRKALSSCALHYMCTIVHKTTPEVPACLQPPCGCMLPQLSPRLLSFALL